MYRLVCLIVLCGLVNFGCTMSDDDRCPKGFEYDSEKRVCILLEEETTDTGDTGDNDDAGDGDAGGADNLSGLGKTCTTDAECKDSDAHYCLEDPTKDLGMDMDAERYCTVPDCSAGGCSSGYKCCDCSSFKNSGQVHLKYWVFCIQDEHTAILETFCSCS